MLFVNKKSGVRVDFGPDFKHPSWEPVGAPAPASEDKPKTAKKPAKKTKE